MRCHPVLCVVIPLVVLAGISIVRGRESLPGHPRVAAVAPKHTVRKYAAPTASSELSSAITVGAIVIGLFFRQKVRVEPA